MDGRDGTDGITLDGTGNEPALDEMTNDLHGSMTRHYLEQGSAVFLRWGYLPTTYGLAGGTYSGATPFLLGPWE